MAASPAFSEEGWRRLGLARMWWCMCPWHSAVLGSGFKTSLGRAVRMMDLKGRAAASAGSPQGLQAAHGDFCPMSHVCDGGGMRLVESLLPAQGLALGAATSVGTWTRAEASSGSSTEGPCSL